MSQCLEDFQRIWYDYKTTERNSGEILHGLKTFIENTSTLERIKCTACPVKMVRGAWRNYAAHKPSKELRKLKTFQQDTAKDDWSFLIVACPNDYYVIYAYKDVPLAMECNNSIITDRRTMNRLLKAIVDGCIAGENEVI
jgi:hypothetical protein